MATTIVQIAREIQYVNPPVPCTTLTPPAHFSNYELVCWAVFRFFLTFFSDFGWVRSVLLRFWFLVFFSLLRCGDNTKKRQRQTNIWTSERPHQQQTSGGKTAREKVNIHIHNNNDIALDKLGQIRKGRRKGWAQGGFSVAHHLWARPWLTRKSAPSSTLFPHFEPHNFWPICPVPFRVHFFIWLSVAATSFLLKWPRLKDVHFGRGSPKVGKTQEKVDR